MPPQGQEGGRPSCQERDPCGDISALMLRDVTLTNVGVICCQNVATPTSHRLPWRCNRMFHAAAILHELILLISRAEAIHSRRLFKALSRPPSQSFSLPFFFPAHLEATTNFRPHSTRELPPDVGGRAASRLVIERNENPTSLSRYSERKRGSQCGRSSSRESTRRPRSSIFANRLDHFPGEGMCAVSPALGANFPFPPRDNLCSPAKRPADRTPDEMQATAAAAECNVSNDLRAFSLSPFITHFALKRRFRFALSSHNTA